MSELSKEDLYAIARTKELFESLKWDELEYLGRPESGDKVAQAGACLARCLVHIDDALHEQGKGVKGEEWGKLIVLAGLAVIAAHKDKAARAAAN